MSVLSDVEIREEIRRRTLLVEPFKLDMVRENGLDLSIGDSFCTFKRGVVLDPDRPGDWEDYYECERTDAYLLRAGRRVLVHTQETVRMPRYLVGFVNIRSTWARAGIFAPPTIVDAGFHGQIVVEIVGGDFDIVLRPGYRILHLVIARTGMPVRKVYSGDYQGQRGVRMPKFFGEDAVFPYRLGRR